MPDWVVGLILQIPLAAAVTWAFVRGLIHSDPELRQMRNDYEARLLARDQRANDFRTMYEQERQDRILSNERLSEATNSIRDIVASVEDLTREVIRASK